jgi:two-component system response regulator NreC
MMIRLMLIEDHEMVRAGFRMLLEAQPDMEIIGEAASGEEGLNLAASLDPDVILLDVSMPGIGGAETARAIKERLPSVAILAVTIHDDQAYLLQMLDAGADGYLPKRAAAAELVSAVRTVYARERYIHSSLIGALVNGYLRRPDEKPSRALTRRQLEVLALVARGFTNQRVAVELGLSPRTVDRHLENMMRRLGMHTRVELVSYALRERWIELDD